MDAVSLAPSTPLAVSSASTQSRLRLRCASLPDDADASKTPRHHMSENNDNVGLGGLFDFSFEKFITPSVVKIVYILVIVMAGLTWLMMIVAGLSNGIGGFLFGAVFGGLMFIIIILIYRIFLELTMILFRIHDNTEKLANRP
jgi:hypothetical protein